MTLLESAAGYGRQTRAQQHSSGHRGWVVDEPPLYRALAEGFVAASRPGHERVLYIDFGGEALADANHVERIDAAGRSSLGRPGPLADEIERRVHESPPACVVVDQLGRVVRRWKDGDPARFFGRICPTMLQSGVTAYWGIDRSLGRSFAEDVRQITQCMVDVRGGRLRVLKAEGRPRALEGLTHRLQLDDSGRIIVSSGPAGGRLARGLLAVRQQLGLTQQELAAIAEVTPSAISQAEAGARGLSLDTVVSIADRLELPVDRLLGTTMTPTYRIGWRSRRNTRLRGAGGRRRLR